MEVIQFDGLIGEIESFDSFYKDFDLMDGVITIPWLNLGFYDHPINLDKDSSTDFYDKVYLSIEDIYLCLKNGEIIFRSCNISKSCYKIFYIEGVNVETNQLDSFNFICKDVKVIIPFDSRKSKISWSNDANFFKEIKNI